MTATHATDETAHIARAAAALGDEFAGRAIRDRLHEIERALKFDDDMDRRRALRREFLDLTDEKTAA